MVTCIGPFYVGDRRIGSDLASPRTRQALQTIERKLLVSRMPVVFLALPMRFVQKRLDMVTRPQCKAQIETISRRKFLRKYSSRLLPISSKNRGAN